MKKKGIKRALAFLLAVVFAFSTCMTAGPYTVQATEAGQTGSGEEEVGGGTTPDQGGTVDEKLSVKVVNNASIDIGPGLSDVNLKLTYNNGTEASLTIGKDQIGETVNTDISYDEVVAGTYDVVISDTNGLYNVTAETGIDEASKTLMITITGLSVKTDDNSISGAADDTVYAADENTFSVVGSWANYIDTWEIRDNTSGATIEENGKNCKVTTSRGSQDGAPAAFTIVAKVGTQEIASKLVTVKRKPTSLSVSSGEENGWLFSKEVDVKATLEAVEDDKYIPTDAAKGEIEAYKEVIFKNYDSKLKNVAENEAAQKMYFKPETLNNNVEFVSASATDIATFTNNYKIQDKRPSIEKELTIQKRVLELSVGNTSRGFRDLDYTRALDTLVSVNATTGETGFVTGERLYEMK